MNWKAIAIAAGVLLTLGLLLFVIYRQNEKIDSLTHQLTQQPIRPQEQLEGGITRAETISTESGGAAEAAKDAGVDIAVIVKDGKKIGQRIDNTGVIIINTPGAKDAGLDATEVAVTDAGKRQETLRLDEPFTNLSKPVPFGRASYTENEAHPWSVEIFSRKYQVAIVQTVDQDGNRSEYSKFTIGVGKESFTVPIETARFYQDRSEAKLRWNFLPFLGVDAGGKANPPAAFEVTPVAQVSLASYGKTRNLPSWTFANLGLGYAARMNSLVFVLTPLAYNLGEPLPLFTNLYFGPSFGASMRGDLVLSLGVRMEL